MVLRLFISASTPVPSGSQFPSSPTPMTLAFRISPALRLRSVFLALAAAVPAVLPAADQPLPEQARAALAKSTAFMQSIATEGGYLWRYSPDLKERAGENVATATQIWVQPPGTPSMGQLFLRAHEITGEARYLEAAKDAAHALATGQLESGGWDYLVEFDPKLSGNWYRRSDAGRISAEDAAKRKNVSTYDDDNTQSALRLLMAVADASKGSNDPRDVLIRQARDYGLAKLVAVQRPAGGWPQRWDGKPVDPKQYPLQAAHFPTDYPRQHPALNYYGYYTLNDNTQRDAVMTLLEAAKRLNKPEFRAAALRGGEFLIRAQLPEPQPVWAQQYNPQMEPAWARAFEPPSVCSRESGDAMRLLVDLYLETGDEKFMEPMPRAIAWFKRSEVAPNTWARMYEIGTNKPVFGDRDGKIYYRVEDISQERQTGYSWRGAYGIPAAIAYYEEVKREGRTAILEKRKAAETAAKSRKAERAKALEPRVRSLVASLDGQGRWIAPYRGGAAQIRTDSYIANATVLCDYLEAMK